MRYRTRPAFTLIELLVVIAIIAILAGLTLAGVMRFLILGPKMQTQSDINQFGVSLGSFKAKYQIYPPSKIKLCSNRAEYGNTALDIESVRYLGQMWPKLGNWSNIDWAGIGSNLPAGGIILEGDQCLVFFLGGIPHQSPPGYLGFSADVTNPANLTALGGNVPASATTTKFFEFNSGRLFKRDPAKNPFFSYKDGFGDSPYLYFSHGFAKNGYRDASNSAGVNSHEITLAVGSPATTVTVAPYYDTATPRRFLLPETFQIISAGPDLVYGPGGLWTSANPATGKGADDLTNIQGAPMGAVQP